MRGEVVASGGQEAEWQFEASDLLPVERWLERRCGSGDVSVAPGGRRDLTDVYVDTENWRVYRAGYAVRIRQRRGGCPEATIKLLAPGREGLRRRLEVSERLSSARIKAVSEAPGEVGRRVRALAGPEPLRALFELRTRRRTYALVLDGEEAGEVALDETEIPLEHGKPAVLRRVEVEVRNEVLLPEVRAFAERLREECRLSPADLCKFEAGLLIREVKPPGLTEPGRRA